uniref:Late embryogenesis abundant protein LEA-2 subgroup domain-containing protein n=1 Tax=Leersia perrieri TaxID=77586 RepID=A0A0D9WL71_9ORYZ
MATAASGWKGGKNNKRYVMAALVGMLVLVAIVSIVSVVLSPAHVFFYITDLSRDARNKNKSAQDEADYDLQVKLVANNTSHHAKVRYQSINVELWLDSNHRYLLYVQDYLLSEQWQPPRNSTEYSATGPSYFYGNSTHDDYGVTYNNRSRYPMLLIETVVQFRYGPSRTRMYTVAVSCPSVTVPWFFGEAEGGGDHLNNTIANYPPVNCTA